MRIIIILFFLTSCSSQTLNSNMYNENLQFSMDLSFDQYKEFLIQYNSISNYPDINK